MRTGGSWKASAWSSHGKRGGGRRERSRFGEGRRSRGKPAASGSSWQPWRSSMEVPCPKETSRGMSRGRGKQRGKRRGRETGEKRRRRGALAWCSATREGGRRIHRTGTRQGAPWMSRGVCVRRCGEAEPDGGVSTAEGEAGGVRNGWVRPGTGRRRAVGHGDDTAGQEEEHGTGARALRDEGRRRAEPGARRCSPARAWPGSGGP